MKTGQFEHRYAQLRTLIDRKLASGIRHNGSVVLATGSRYVLLAPGKRVRSTLVLLSCEAVGGQIREALDAAVALEMLHNFTLVHDDIMDNAPSRRGRQTVHTKWTVNNAILVGDFILGLAYKNLLKSKTADMQRVIQLFTEGFVDVCVGQGLDMEFGTQTRISLKEYYRMIGKKTGKLIATATELGAVLGNAPPKQTQALREFGTRISKAFKIQDDLLDVVAKEKAFGKTIGGDIVEGKRTFLLIRALEQTRGRDRAILQRVMRRTVRPSTAARRDKLVDSVTSVYKRADAIEAARRQIERETIAGLKALRTLPASDARATLQWFSEMLVQRTS